MQVAGQAPARAFGAPFDPAAGPPTGARHASNGAIENDRSSYPHAGDQRITLGRVTGTVPPDGQHDQPARHQQNPTGGWQQPSFYLNDLAPPQPPKRFPTWAILTIAGLVLFVAVAAFALAALPESDPRSSPDVETPAHALPDQTRSATPTRPVDSAGRQACNEVKKANASGVTDPAALAGAANVGQRSTNTSIQIVSALLADWAKLAVAARGAPDEKATLDKLAESARTLEARCTTFGYYGS